MKRKPNTGKKLGDVLREAYQAYITESSNGVPVVSEPGVSYQNSLSDPLWKVELVRRGISFSLFSLIKPYMPFEEKDWARLLDISARVLKPGIQGEGFFGSAVSGKIIDVVEVTSMGEDVFGSMDRFRLWLETPNYALGNERPKDLLARIGGKALVTAELEHINHGILA